MTCIKCHSNDTELYRDEQGHFCKRCHECVYDWGPFVSPSILRERGESHHYPELCGELDEDEGDAQMSLADF